jgi:glycosyltransferase involved in cell wall biosynthesis
MIVSSRATAGPQSLAVLHVIPTLEGGGAERQLSLLAADQARRGYHVHVAVRRPGVHAQAMRDGGVAVHELGDIRSIDPRLFLALRRIIGLVKPDIVQTWLPQMDIVGGLAVLSSRLPWIMTERTSGLYYDEVPLTARLRLLLGRSASAVVANSDGGAHYWRGKDYPASRLATIRNALDIERIRSAAAAGVGESLPAPVLLVVGRFNHAKALEIIVRAAGEFSKHAPVNVVMIGEGPEQGVLEHEIAAASLTGSVRILPYQADWWRWLRGAAGLISMSRYEGNPNVVLEAMAGCCPVILSDIPAHREVADESSALFVPVDDVHALSSAMAKLLANQQAAQERAERAFMHVKSMSVTVMADAYEATYRSVLNGTS